jgi:kynureninase
MSDASLMAHYAEQFNLPNGHYLLSHSVGCLPKAAEQSLRTHYLQAWQQHGGDGWPTWLATIDEFCAELAVLLNAKAEELCPQVNVSSAFTKYLQALPKPTAKNQILMHASAFPSLGFVAQALAGQGYELTLIDAQLNPTDLKVWAEHLNERTALTLVTHVHSNTGVLSPVADICQLAHQYQAKVVVDVAQSVGVVPIDVMQWGVDCVLGSCVKWLCGGPGAGFMWLKPSSIAELMPVDVGWFSHAQPFEFDIRHFSYAKSARRFWGGTPCIAPFATALGSLQTINAIGIECIAQHNRHLRQILYSAFVGLIDAELDLDNSGGTLCLSIKTEYLDSLKQLLKSKACFVDQRGSVLRMSPHIYNDEAAMQALARDIAMLV